MTPEEKARRDVRRGYFDPLPNYNDEDSQAYIDEWFDYDSAKRKEREHEPV